jgi:hypothetical protein
MVHMLFLTLANTVDDDEVKPTDSDDQLDERGHEGAEDMRFIV